jgi:hypothetical protein
MAADWKLSEQSFRSAAFLFQGGLAPGADIEAPAARDPDPRKCPGAPVVPEIETAFQSWRKLNNADTGALRSFKNKYSELAPLARDSKLAC